MQFPIHVDNSIDMRSAQDHKGNMSTIRRERRTKIDSRSVKLEGFLYRTFCLILTHLFMLYSLHDLFRESSLAWSRIMGRMGGRIIESSRTESSLHIRRIDEDAI